jgi:hypothetical protein
MIESLSNRPGSKVIHKEFKFCMLLHSAHHEYSNLSRDDSCEKVLSGALFTRNFLASPDVLGPSQLLSRMKAILHLES